MNRKQREIKRKRENQRRMMAKTAEHKEAIARRWAALLCGEIESEKQYGWTRFVSWGAL